MEVVLDVIAQDQPGLADLDRRHDPVAQPALGDRAVGQSEDLGEVIDAEAFRQALKEPVERISHHNHLHPCIRHSTQKWLE